MLLEETFFQTTEFKATTVINCFVFNLRKLKPYSPATSYRLCSVTMELDINQNTLLVILISVSFFMVTCTLYFNSQNYKLLMKLIKHVDVVVRAQLSIAKSCNIHIDLRVCRYLDCERIERKNIDWKVIWKCIDISSLVE